MHRLQITEKHFKTMEGYFSSITTQNYFLSYALINQHSGKGSSADNTQAIHKILQ